jgi:hypothetical protein
MEHPIVPKAVGPQAAKILSPDAPLPARMMAASGMAPLPPADLVSVLYVLSFDRDTQVSDRARASLQDLPDPILLGTLSQGLEAPVLDGLARLLLRHGEAQQRIILNHHTPDETVVWLAEKLQSEKLLEMICANEQRLLACPVIIEKLYFNKHSRMSSIDRAIELAVRNGIELTGIPAFEEAKKAIEGELIFEPDDAPNPDDLVFMDALNFTAEELADYDREDRVDALNDILDALDPSMETADGQELSEDDKQKVNNLQNAISRMTVSQKVRTAMLGNASQRAILIRDANKLVIMAVLKSPSVNDAEVRRYSCLKSLPDEAIRHIATKREWTKNYTVKLNLVNNPRTPVEHALRFLNHLRPNDIRMLERSKDIPGVVKKAAVELRKKRTS